MLTSLSASDVALVAEALAAAARLRAAAFRVSGPRNSSELGQAPKERLTTFPLPLVVLAVSADSEPLPPSAAAAADLDLVEGRRSEVGTAIGALASDVLAMAAVVASWRFTRGHRKSSTDINVASGSMSTMFVE